VTCRSVTFSQRIVAISATDGFQKRCGAKMPDRPAAGQGTRTNVERVAEKVNIKRTIWWDGQQVAVVDQRYLPYRVVVQRWRTVDDVVDGIREMQIRGAPLIGVAAVHGVALAMAAKPTDKALDAAITSLMATRPTAVNLRHALERVDEDIRSRAPEVRAAAARVLAAAMADEDAAACRAIGEVGARLIYDVADRVDRPVQILTHCNAGWLACVEWGTATAPVYVARERGVRVHVWVSETRPRNQGSALTAWELSQRGVPHTVVVDNAAGHLLRSGLVDLVIVGADRVAANGDVANKIGTYLKALAARDSDIPFYVAAPTSSFDLRAPTGEVIPIEERGDHEVTKVYGWTENGHTAGVTITPPGTDVRNWGFDVTPARLVSAFITERGVIAAAPEAIARALPA
jgi:methylthioribose-1-phosphate isomerase